MKRTKPIVKRNPVAKKRVVPKARRPAVVSGFCPICGRNDIPIGAGMSDHLSKHELALEIDELGADQYQDLQDRFVPGVKEYRKVVRRAMAAASEVNELARMFSLKDKRRDKPASKRKGR